MKTILNLEWTSYPSRDRESSTLVCNYLRYMGYTVIEGSVHNGFRLINKYKPDLLFIAGTAGAGVNVNLMKYAKSKGIYGISGMPEGNIRKESIETFVWGNNKDFKLFEDKWMVWSERAKKMILDKYPELENKMFVSGGVGFDKYKIAISNNTWLNKYNINNKVIVGIGCWDFGIVDKRDTRYNIVKNWLSDEDVSYFKNEQLMFNEQLESLIKKNKNIIFLIKEHPGVQLGRYASAIQGCEKYDNVIIIKNEQSIYECISASNIWISYESTTAMEAWLLGKPTGLLNPSGIDFPLRHNLQHAQPNYKNADEWTDVLSTFVDTQNLPKFDDLKNERDKAINDVIQWGDGLNHVRLGNAIIDLLESGVNPTTFPDNVNMESISLKRRIEQSILWKYCFYLRMFRSYKLFFENIRSKWDDNKLREFSEKRMREQIHFYDLNGLSKKQLRNIQVV